MNELSPLRYPGGKARVAPYIRQIFELNGLGDGHYIEPYAGGAGVALSLLLSEVALVIHINDLDYAIYSFWKAVLEDTEALCRAIHQVPLTVDEWRRQREVQFVAGTDPLDLAISTFYLNRTNRSGIIRNGGVIGGLEQTGKWGIDARFNRLGLVSRIERIAAYRDRIRLTNLDALVFLRGLEPELPAKALIYLDPPYYVKGGGLYANSYRHDDHAEVAGHVASLRTPWVVSYDNVPLIRQLYEPYRRIEYGLRYTAREKYEGEEVMFFSPRLRLPPIDDPSNARPGRLCTRAKSESERPAA